MLPTFARLRTVFARNLAVHLTPCAVRASTYCGDAAFGPLFLLASLGWWLGNEVFHGPDRWPFIAYTGAISVLAIVMTWLILLAAARQSARDRLQAQETHDHVRESHESIKSLLAIQDEELRLLREDTALFHDAFTGLHETLSHLLGLLEAQP